MKPKTIMSIIILAIVAGCAQGIDPFDVPVAHEDYLGDMAKTESNYAYRRCSELGVDPNSPAWAACMREKGAARWALKHCGGHWNTTAYWWPELCAMADLD